MGPTSVSVVVADKGLGLDLDLHVPHRQPRLLEPGGRGFYVMACIMDELEVHVDGGTVIRTSKAHPCARRRVTVERHPVRLAASG